MRIAGQPRRRRQPHLLTQERSIVLGGTDCVEEDEFHDVVRIVIGLQDTYCGDTGLLPRGRTASEVLQPRVEVGDPVFDVQDGHGPIVAIRPRKHELATRPLPQYIQTPNILAGPSPACDSTGRREEWLTGIATTR